MHSIENEGFACDKRFAFPSQFVPHAMRNSIDHRIPITEVPKVTVDTLQSVKMHDVLCDNEPEIRSLCPYVAESLPTSGIEQPIRVAKPETTDFNAWSMSLLNPVLTSAGVDNFSSKQSVHLGNNAEFT